LKSIGILNYFYVWYLCNSMRYIYNIKDKDGNQETIKGMSFKKLLKQLNNKYDPNTIIQVKYINKKDHELLKYIKTKKVE
jgi:hypothetical protein